MTADILCWRVILYMLAIAAPVHLYGQGSVTIYGTVTDSSRAAVPGVSITLTNMQTAAVRTTTSDAGGNYVLSQLPIGVYALRTEARGFKAFIQSDIRAQVDENRQINITMQLGSVKESVTVKAEAVQVETRSGALREVVDSARIVELPLNGRNPIQLQYLVAGSGGRAAADQAENESVSINGSRTNSNNYTLDAGDNHDPYFNTPSVFPSPDALEEFSIQTNSYGADKGRNAGALMNAVTKSGTNQFHSALFEFLRNEKLNARNFFANDVSPFKRNQFGGTAGGPIRKDKTFFFASYQRTSERSSPGAVTATVPTAEQRQGDFSSLSKPLKDPAGGNFTNNKIPEARLNSAALKFLDAFVPLPNRPNGLFTFASGQKFDDDQLTAKIDHHLNAANHLSGRMLYNFNDRAEATGNLPGFFAAIKYRNWNVVATDTHIIGPAVVNTFTFSYNDITRRQLPIVPGNKSWTDFGGGFTRATTSDAPVGHDTMVDGYFQAFSRFPLNHFRKSIQFSDALSLNRGAHFIRLGGEVRRSILNLEELFQIDPQVRFRATFTGDAGADFMLGRPTTFTQIAENSNRPRTTELAAFFQDDWKVSARLTLNLGVRWDPYFPFSDLDNTFSQVRLGRQSTLFPSAPPGILFAGDLAIPAATLDNQLGNFGPRLGFAFDPAGSGKLSIRGGYGVFYSQIRQQGNNQVSTNQPFSIKLNMNNPSQGLNNPYADSGNPFPFTPPNSANARAAYKFITPLTITEWDPNFRDAIAQQWNINVQREFFETYLVTIAYVGSKGNHLFRTNQLNPAIFGAPGNTVDKRRPLFPIFGPITDQSSEANSNYHSLQITLNKRLSKGLTLLSDYTWSKLIDDASSDGDVPANPFDLRNERGPSNFDITHRFVTSLIWQMPRFTSHGAVFRYLLGGWETNGIVTLEGGRPFNVVSGRDNSASAVNQDRADQIGDPSLAGWRPRGQRITQYFNTAAFAPNPAGTFGNVGRNSLRGPGPATVDFGVIKSIPIRERTFVQLRTEVFNLFNRVNLGNPNANQSSNNFGTITSAGSPRVIQMALKLLL